MHGTGHRGACAGFTLFELLVTLALIGLLAGLSLPYLARGHGSAALQADARLLAAQLRAAREAALATHTRREVVIDLARPGLRRAADSGVTPFSSATRLRVAAARGVLTTGQATISFAADGSSSGGAVDLVGTAGTCRVEVDWLTGAVRIIGSDG